MTLGPRAYISSVYLPHVAFNELLIRLTRGQTNSIRQLRGGNMAGTPVKIRTVTSMHPGTLEQTVKTAISATSHGLLSMIVSVL